MFRGLRNIAVLSSFPYFLAIFCRVLLEFSRVEFCIFFSGGEFFFSGVILLHFSRAQFFFLGQFWRFFLGYFQFFSGRKLKIFSGRADFFSGKKKNTDPRGCFWNQKKSCLERFKNERSQIGNPKGTTSGSPPGDKIVSQIRHNILITRTEIKQN